MIFLGKKNKKFKKQVYGEIYFTIEVDVLEGLQPQDCTTFKQVIQSYTHTHTRACTHILPLEQPKVFQS